MKREHDFLKIFFQLAQVIKKNYSANHTFEKKNFLLFTLWNELKKIEIEPWTFLCFF